MKKLPVILIYLAILLILLISGKFANAQIAPGFNAVLNKKQSAPIGKDSIKVNFSDSAVSVAGWVNLTGDPHLNILSATNTSGHISVTSVSKANWFQYSGCTCSAYPGNGNTSYTALPSQVVKEVWFSYNNSSVNQDLYDSTKAKFHFSGLIQGKTYKIVAGASLNSSFAVFVCTTSFHVKGTLASLNGEQHFNAQNNTSTVATFTGVIPSLTGTIDVYVNAFAGNDIGMVTAVQLWQEN